MMYLLPEDPYQDMPDFEDRAFLGWEEPSNDALDRTPERIDLLTERMDAEPTSDYDLEGRVW